MDKYEKLRACGTNGDNFDLGTEDIINKLKDWDERYEIELSEITFDSVSVYFKTFPMI